MGDMTDEHGFAFRGVVFHPGGLFMTIGTDSLGRVDPDGDVAGHFNATRIVDTAGREWRIKRWTKRPFARLRHRRGGDSHKVDIEQVGQLSLEELRSRLEAAMTPDVFEHAHIDAEAQREVLDAVAQGESFDDLVRATRSFC